MSAEDKTASSTVLDTWEQKQSSRRATEILEELEAEVWSDQPSTTAPLADAEQLNAAVFSPWPSRLWRLLLAMVALAAVGQWVDWTIAAWHWQPLLGAALGALGALFLVVAMLSWRDLYRQRLRMTRLQQLREQMDQALAAEQDHMPAEWLAGVRQLYQGTALQMQLEQALDGLDAAHSAAEIQGRLNQLFYSSLDQQARQLIRREASGTGVLVATSPWVAVDLLLVVWRNVRLVQRLALLFGLPAGQLNRWRLLAHVLRNIALAGSSELAIGALSDSLLAGMLEKLAARVGQGIGVGLYSARLGHFTLDLCRVVPLTDRKALREDGLGVVQGIKARVTGRTDEQV
ncbi:TIGR01620 family protein [Halopseudomonas salegens]|uniref:Putative membrane protein n=1 Tax=Halopseudomonas salegens TaxID=1434072 RepID=A0A1H2ETM8_9GAMM|nr:TIGR01620 family protein [Halopseudomonas salegens]SDT98522.1 putative membrane protein [Halopseudomonas salegens]